MDIWGLVYHGQPVVKTIQQAFRGFLQDELSGFVQHEIPPTLPASISTVRRHPLIEKTFTLADMDGFMPRICSIKETLVESESQ